jgi:hypothetical protein
LAKINVGGVSNYIKVCCAKTTFLSAREKGKFTGKFVSLMPVLGYICKLMTKQLHHVIESRNEGWDSVLDISQSEGAVREI